MLIYNKYVYIFIYSDFKNYFCLTGLSIQRQSPN